jgi:hypothetical protein
MSASPDSFAIGLGGHQWQGRRNEQNFQFHATDWKSSIRTAIAGKQFQTQLVALFPAAALRRHFKVT